MSSASDTLKVLARVTNEAEANVIVNYLTDSGIAATSVGEFTCGFRAEAPGDVSILVKSGDFAHAQDILASIRQELSCEGMNDTEEEEDSQSTKPHYKSPWRLLVQLGLITDAFCILIALIIYIVTLDSTLLVYAFTAAVLLLLIFKLSWR